MTPLQILKKKNATKAQLRKALAEALGVEYEEPASKSTENEFFKPCLNAFLTRYEEVTKLKYSFTAKDGKSLKNIIEKLQAISINTDVVTSFNYMIRHLPQWYIQNAFSLTVIDGKFNEIISSIKASNGGKQQTGKSRVQYSDDFKRKIAQGLQSC